jgi:uncharacterized Zn-finger protein
MTQEHKACIRCNEPKSISEFGSHKDTKDGIHSWCKVCVSKYQKEYQEANKEKIATAAKQRREEKKYRKQKKLEKERKLKDSKNRGVERLVERNIERMTQAKKQKALIADRMHVANWKKKPAQFILWGERLTADESPIADEDGFLLISCFYCGTKFTPTNTYVQRTLQSREKYKRGGNLFCSEECKEIYLEKVREERVLQAPRINIELQQKQKESRIYKRITNFDMGSRKDLLWFSNKRHLVEKYDCSWYEKNAETIDRYLEEDNERIRQEASERYKIMYYENQAAEIEKSKAWRTRKAIYNSWASQLTVEESPKEDKEGNLLVKCAYCGRYFNPNNAAVQLRIRALTGRGTAAEECRLYCSDGCKLACPIYNQNIWPKGYKKASSREVDPLLRQMCLKLDDYTCQLCYKTIDQVELHCHHEKGVRLNPIFANDIDNTITLCKKCHKKVHSKWGCRYIDLRCIDKIDV